MELRRITRVLKFVYFYVEFPLQPFAFFCPFFIGITDFYDKKMTSIFVAIYRDASLPAKRARPPLFFAKMHGKKHSPPLMCGCGVGGLVGWLGWLVGWLAGWLVGWLVIGFDSLV